MIVYKIFEEVDITRNFWNSFTLRNRFLILLGLIALLHNAVTVFYNSHSTDPADVAIRSVMSSIFGFFFGTQAVNNNHLNTQLQTIVAGNVALLTLLVVIASNWANVDHGSASIVELRNLMFSAVGFLLGRSDNKE
jgi:cell division protein FtsL